MRSESWPSDTSVPEMRDRVGARAREIRRHRRGRNAVFAGALSVALLVMGVAYLGSSPGTSSVRTTPAAEGDTPIDGAAPDEGGAVAAPDGGSGGKQATNAEGKPRTRDGAALPPSPVQTVTTLATPFQTTTTPRPAAPAGSRTVAFVRGERIWLAYPDGSDIGPLTDASRRIKYPDWAPDGRSLVAVELHNDVTGMAVGTLMVVGLDGSVRLLADAASYVAPKWSPDGARIAVARLVSPGWTAPKYELWVMDADGSNERRLAIDTARVASWSPDGKRLAYGCPGGTCIVNHDGTGLRTLPDTTNHFNPTWSPDGNRLLVHTFNGSQSTLLTMNVDGGDRRAVSTFPGSVNDLEWSPDGRTILYSVTETDVRIWQVRVDGSDRRRMTDGPQDFSPTWK